jgi:capsular exopolysaccharide synthesis family protein
VSRYRWWIIATTILVAAIVALLTLRLPKVYQASVVIEYDPKPVSPLGNSVEGVSTQISHFWMSREFFDTQNLIIKSRAVAERVVERLGLRSDPSFWGQEDNPDWMPVSKEVAAQKFQGMLTVDPVKNTRLVRLHIRDTDPERAATLANTLADTYIEKTMEDKLGSVASAADWLAQRLESTRKSLNESENALHQFKQQHNVLSVSLENRQNLLAEEIREYNERLTETRARRIELQARLERLKRSRANPSAVRDDVGDGDSQLDALRETLRANTTERASLSGRYGDSHPTIVRLDREIAAVRQSIDEEIDTLIEAAEDDLREIQSVEAGLSKAQDQSQKAGLELNLREIEYSRLNRQRDTSSKLYDLLLQRSAETNLTQLLRTTTLRVVDRALVPKAAISPVLPLNLFGGVLGGLLLGLGIAFVLGRMDSRVQDVSDVEQLGLRVLGVFPKVGDSAGEASPPTSMGRRRQPDVTADEVDRIVASQPMSLPSECCRTIRTNLVFMAAESPSKTMVVTSASPKDGKTTVATNVAIAFAQSGQRVLLIDADLRRPRIHETFRLEEEIGLTSVLVGDKTLSDVTREVDIDGLSVVTCGPRPPNPAELLHTPQFARVLAEAESRYDRVIFDSPPLCAVTDAAILAPQCGGALLVIRALSTTRDSIMATMRILGGVGANILGSVLNSVDPSRGNRSYVHGGYYSYYRSEPGTEERDPSKQSQSAA